VLTLHRAEVSAFFNLSREQAEVFQVTQALDTAIPLLRLTDSKTATRAARELLAQLSPSQQLDVVADAVALSDLPVSSASALLDGLTHDETQHSGKLVAVLEMLRALPALRSALRPVLGSLSVAAVLRSADSGSAVALVRAFLRGQAESATALASVIDVVMRGDDETVHAEEVKALAAVLSPAHADGLTRAESPFLASFLDHIATLGMLLRHPGISSNNVISNTAVPPEVLVAVNRFCLVR
jgi:hypothetical protein